MDDCIRNKVFCGPLKPSKIFSVIIVKVGLADHEPIQLRLNWLQYYNFYKKKPSLSKSYKTYVTYAKDKYS